MCRLSWNLEASNSWNPQGMSKPLIWLLYLYLYLWDCTTSQKVKGSIPDVVIGIFHWHNPSSRANALGLTQPLTEMSTSNISWGQRRPVRRADNLTTSMCRLSWNLDTSTSWNPQGLSRPVMGLLYLLLNSLRIRTISGKIRRENRNTLVKFNSLVPKLLPFMR